MLFTDPHHDKLMSVSQGVDFLIFVKIILYKHVSILGKITFTRVQVILLNEKNQDFQSAQLSTARNWQYSEVTLQLTNCFYFLLESGQHVSAFFNNRVSKKTDGN